MNLQRLGFTLFAATAAVSIGACGGGDESITPTGPHYHYVMNKILVPTNATQSAEYSLDLNGNGTADNSIGTALGALSNFGFDIQAAVDKGVLGGKLIALVDVQTPDFSSSSGTGIRFFLGDNPQPAACSGPSDVVTCTSAKPAVCMGCGHHLASGSFSIAASSPDDPAIAGKVTGGTFTGGPGSMTLLISLGDAAPIRFDLIQARVKASGMSEATIGTVSGSTASGGFVLAGALTQDNVDSVVFPGIEAQIASTVMKDCGMPTAPGCGCTINSAGKGIIDALDKDDNCVVSIAEIKAIASAVLQPDLTIDGKPAYSAGLKATAVKATFTVPGQ